VFGRIAIPGFAALLATAAAPGPSAEKATLNGTVTYSERIALPADATTSIRLEEEPRPDSSRRTIAEATISTEERHLPVPFALAYDPARIDPARRYRVPATISAGGRTLFRTAAAYPVLTRGRSRASHDRRGAGGTAPPSSRDAYGSAGVFSFSISPVIGTKRTGMMSFSVMRPSGPFEKTFNSWKNPPTGITIRPPGAS